MIKKIGYKGDKSATPTWLMYVDITVVSKDKDENRSFQPTLWLSSAVEVETVISTDMCHIGVAFLSPL